MKEINFTINNRLFDSYLERMNFLNEISIDYPQAISFGSGRPDEAYFNVRDVISCFQTYAGQSGGAELDSTYNALGQYNKTKGIINEDIARLLEKDEDIKVHPEDIIMADGAQEAMAIIIDTLFDATAGDGVLLVSEPSYIGFVGYAKIAGIPIVGVDRKGDSICLDHLEQTILKLQKEGKHARVLYEVPDFHNPTGAYMPLAERKQLIEMAEKYNFLIVEDNPYGYFRYDSEKIPTLKALDRYRRVLHIGSFSKTLFPAIRLGYIVADQVFNYNNRSVKLVEEFKKTKSFITVNTSTLLQSMVGGFLRRENHSLIASNVDKVKAIGRKRDIMIEALASASWGRGNERGTEAVKWNKPAGGFFLSMDIPFAMTDELLKECVEKYDVIFCPMSFFCLDSNRGTRQIRLAFSNMTPEKIQEGVKRLSAFIRAKNS
ncbi:MAG: PLP-dependent aminotransferase family protein [Acidobacteria bacterium]|jgi:(S)-3,5-dihydroxyphenylglycine transaminase|nr:PLP-dependent aminotransferase family protein [Acidobacteriota bacterium]